MQFVKSKIKSSTLEIKQGAFYNGEIFDAYIFINNLLKSAKKEIIVIDNYIDESILTIFSKYPNIDFTILTKRYLIITKVAFNKMDSNFLKIIREF